MDDQRHENTSQQPCRCGQPGRVAPDFLGPKPARALARRWSLNDDMSALLARNWWAIALRGVFAILFGIIALFMPGACDAGAGVAVRRLHAGRRHLRDRCRRCRAARQHERWGWLVVEGIVDFIAGAHRLRVAAR